MLVSALMAVRLSSFIILRSTARPDHASDFAAFRGEAENLQYIADQFIKQIDGIDGGPIIWVGP